eukprot:TRINITY_DN14682_c0_g1_i1.p1 TRINITY_DN14682_c0_g1~~TRINITY_DN14682_c0_g1_i1.p1  ORF type:complete len:465 (+),score=132.12 TRINITY_DN14682_c0_g1_i1:44-1396(+)
MAAADATPPAAEGPAREKKGRKQKDTFDIAKYPRRLVALRFAYLGHAYNGFAVQENTTATVEHHLFAALRRVRLIDPDGQGMPEGYSRCGRTDKGVSALSQVVAVLLRSNVGDGAAGDAAAAGDEPQKAELDYVNMLNRVLPDDIRITAWAPVPAGFSARFSCSARVYKYFFARGCLDVERMADAARLYVGEHDFRNFCKIDVVNVSQFVRKVLHVSVTQALEDTSDPRSPGSTWVFTVAGTAFLYHQVRCLVAVLFEIGAGREDRSVIAELLRVSDGVRKPVYNMAAEDGLVLWDCLFPNVQWRTSPASHQRLLFHLGEQVRCRSLAPTIFSQMRRQLRTRLPLAFTEDGGAAEPRVWSDAEVDFTQLALECAPTTGQPCARYIPLLKRPVEASYEDRVAGLRGVKKQRKEENDAKAARGKAEASDASAEAVALRVDLTEGIPPESADL